MNRLQAFFMPMLAAAVGAYLGRLLHAAYFADAALHDPEFGRMAYWAGGIVAACLIVAGLEHQRAIPRQWPVFVAGAGLLKLVWIGFFLMISSLKDVWIGTFGLGLFLTMLALLFLGWVLLMLALGRIREMPLRRGWGLLLLGALLLSAVVASGRFFNQAEPAGWMWAMGAGTGTLTYVQWRLLGIRQTQAEQPQV